METTQSPVHDETALPAQRPVSLWIWLGIMAFISVYAIYGSFGLRLWTPRGPGPGFFPFVLAIAILGMTIIWFVQSLRDPVEASSGSTGTSMRHIVISVATLVIVAAAMEWIGFRAAILLFLLYELLVNAKLAWWKALIIGLIASFGGYWLFNDFLGVSLPVGKIPPFTWLGI